MARLKCKLRGKRDPSTFAHTWVTLRYRQRVLWYIMGVVNGPLCIGVSQRIGAPASKRYSKIIIR
jgi:hypothetical protein